MRMFGHGQKSVCSLFNANVYARLWGSRKRESPFIQNKRQWQVYVRDLSSYLVAGVNDVRVYEYVDVYACVHLRVCLFDVLKCCLCLNRFDWELIGNTAIGFISNFGLNFGAIPPVYLSNSIQYFRNIFYI